ncbi:hypothetical protein DL765_004745 [Monosporascus sp. GIB2]|nr:hypothetical protein DL765_004745 [Monosporascus sp. GIB2]
MSTSCIIEPSSRVAASTAILNGCSVANHLATLTGARTRGLPDKLLDKHTADRVQTARLTIEQADELLSQHAITRFRLAHSFQGGGEATFREIAAISGLSETNVRQIIRHAMVKDVFQGPRSGTVSHNSVSRLLAEDPVIHDWVGACREEFIQLPPMHVMLWRASPNLRSRTTRFWRRIPSVPRRFRNAMRSFTEGTGFDLPHIADNFAWGELGDATMVDVGSSQGVVSFGIAAKSLKPSFTAAQKEVPHSSRLLNGAAGEGR